MGPALDFLLRYGVELFSGTPMVFCGISRHEIEGRDLGPNVTGVLMQRQFKETLDVALRLQPDTRQVVVIGGTASFNKYWEAIARQEFREYEGRLAFTYLTNHSMQEILQAVAHLPKHTIILYLHLFKDSVGNMFMPGEALWRISEAANAPVYGFVDQLLGQGIIGGHLFSLEMHGTEAAAAGLRILAGEKPAEMPLLARRANADMFDWRQLQRWEISEDRLPPSSLVRYKVPSMWEQYQGGYHRQQPAVRRPGPAHHRPAAAAQETAAE
jgi:ABC-type uncharacterized transport system substrate-binding protein